MLRICLFALPLTLVAAASVGCQSLNPTHVTNVETSVNEVPVVNVRSESSEEIRNPVILLGREIRETESVNSGDKDAGLWSRLKSPGRFLLPRTEFDDDSAKDLDVTDSLDAGF